jgi:hypothetical protein
MSLPALPMPHFRLPLRLPPRLTPGTSASLTNGSIIPSPISTSLKAEVPLKVSPCREEGCEKKPVYNMPGSPNGLYCVNHKLPEMIDVVSALCKYPNCTKQPSFNIDGKIPLYCKIHKAADMMDVRNTKCLFIDCNKSPSFNYPGITKRLYCGSHKLVGMINVKTALCAEEGCTKVPNYNAKGSLTALYCVSHKTEGMINVKSRLCAYSGCDKQPGYNYAGESKGLFCTLHKEDTMINVIVNLCEAEGCNKCASYGIAGSEKCQFCAEHKSVGMIDLGHKKCAHVGCLKNPYYNAPGQKMAKFCKQHKLAGMIGIVSNLCGHPGCLTRASFGKLFQTKKHCAKHKKVNEYRDNHPRCESPNCKTKPFFVDKGNYPKRCEQHKLDSDVNIIESPCCICGIIDLINDTTKLCNNCDDYHVKRVHKAKEKFVGDFLEKAGFVFESEDKIIVNGCSKYRPDFIIDYLLFKVVLEVDENQHQGYDENCEIGRMKQIFHDFGGTPVLFIRYNPDNYVDHLERKCNDSPNTRATKLITLLNQLHNHDNIFPLSVCYLYYDKFNGNTKFSELDPYEV